MTFLCSVFPLHSGTKRKSIESGRYCEREFVAVKLQDSESLSIAPFTSVISVYWSLRSQSRNMAGGLPWHRCRISNGAFH